VTAAIRDAVCLVGDPLDGWQETVARYDASGLFARVGVPDSQSIYPDVYVRCALLARLGIGAGFGPFVINPVTRSPAVAAAEITGLACLAPDRVFLGIGRGDSALATVGRRPVATDEFESYVLAVRILLAGNQARWQGQVLRPPERAVPVPIYIAAVGPRSLRLAGRLGDGVIIGAGIDEDTVRSSLRQVAEGAREAGRDPAGLDVWWYALAGLADDEAEAERELRHSLASFANAAFKGGTRGKGIPERFLPAVARLTGGYNPMAHARAGNRQHTALVADPDFRAYLLRRFALCGTPEQVARQRARAARAGAAQLWLSVRSPDKNRSLRLLSQSRAVGLPA
jgi:5,10-methylenetetrahydromethanopterin reductase